MGKSFSSWGQWFSSLLGILFLILLFSPPVGAQSGVEMQKAFLNYLEAAAQRQGARVADLYSEEGAKYWTQRLQDAQTLSQEELLKRPSYQVLNVLVLRKRIRDYAPLANSSGRQWLEYSYGKGWNSFSTLEAFHQSKSQLELIPEVHGSQGELKIKLAGQLLPEPFPYILEKGSWKIDGLRYWKREESKMEDGRGEAQLSKKEFVETLFFQQVQEAFSPELWNPVSQ